MGRFLIYLPVNSEPGSAIKLDMDCAQPGRIHGLKNFIIKQIAILSN